MNISWVCTETWGCGKFFKKLYCLLNSSVFLPITNSPKQLGIFIIISHGKDDMYFSRFFLLVLEFFSWQILIIQEWTKFITIWEWPSIALRKQYMILNIRDCSHRYLHHTIYGISQMTKVTKNSHYQMIVLCIHTIYFLPYQTWGIKGRNISILIMLWLVVFYV